MPITRSPSVNRDSQLAFRVMVCSTDCRDLASAEKVAAKRPTLSTLNEVVVDPGVDYAHAVEPMGDARYEGSPDFAKAIINFRANPHGVAGEVSLAGLIRPFDTI